MTDVATQTPLRRDLTVGAVVVALAVVLWVVDLTVAERMLPSLALLAVVAGVVRGRVESWSIGDGGLSYRRLGRVRTIAAHELVSVEPIVDEFGQTEALVLRSPETVITLPTAESDGQSRFADAFVQYLSATGTPVPSEPQLV